MRYGGRGGSHAAIMTLGGNKRKRRGRGPRPLLMGASEDEQRQREFHVSPALIITAAAALCVAIWTGLSALPARVSKADTSAGLALLETLEQRDPEAVDEILRQRAPENPLGDSNVDDLSDAEVWGAFRDYVILGDSRAVGFYYFDFLEESRVLADGGNTIRQVEEHMDELVALQPRYVFLCYGLNDVSIGYWDTAEEYTEELLDAISSLEEHLPGVKVVVSSILPARDPAFEMSTAWYNIPDFNQVIAAACREKGVAYADNNAISDAYPELWDPDGIHVREAFYPYWARNLIKAVGADE